LFTWFQSPENHERRAPWYLCGWLAAAEAFWLCMPHPTFARYFLFCMPFLSMLAPVGLRAIATRIHPAGGPWLPALLVIFLAAGDLGKWYFEDVADAYNWSDMEKTAAVVNQVTPPGASLHADEMVYFAADRIPPSGEELQDSHKLQLAPDRAALVHVYSNAELHQRILAGRFDTFQTCYPAGYEKLGLDKLYEHKRDFEDNDCVVYWGWKGTQPK